MFKLKRGTFAFLCFAHFAELYRHGRDAYAGPKEIETRCSIRPCKEKALVEIYPYLAEESRKWKL